MLRTRISLPSFRSFSESARSNQGERSNPPRREFVPDRHVLDAADEDRAQPLHRSGQLRVIEALREIAEDNFQL